MHRHHFDANWRYQVKSDPSSRDLSHRVKAFFFRSGAGLHKFGMTQSVEKRLGIQYSVSPKLCLTVLCFFFCVSCTLISLYVTLLLFGYYSLLTCLNTKSISAFCCMPNTMYVKRPPLQRQTYTYILTYYGKSIQAIIQTVFQLMSDCTYTHTYIHTYECVIRETCWADNALRTHSVGTSTDHHPLTSDACSI